MKKKAPTKKQIAFVRELIRELKYALYLTEYDITVDYPPENCKETSFVGKNVAAQMDINTSYLFATMTIFPLFFQQTIAEQRTTIVHEMCHIYTEPYKNLWEAQHGGKLVTADQESAVNERLTTFIERAVEEAFRDRLKKIK
jgi:hypothetical protein